MERILGEQEIWYPLSDLFIDNEIPYESVARKIFHYSNEIIEYTLFYEVAPVCAPNLLTAAPIAWGGFNKKALEENITKHVFKYSNSKAYEFLIDIKASIYKRKFKSEWEVLKKYIEDKRGQTL